MIEKFTIADDTDVQLYYNTVGAKSYSIFFVIIDNVITLSADEYISLTMTKSGSLTGIDSWNINRNMETSNNLQSQTFVFFVKNTTTNPITINTIVHAFLKKASITLEFLQLHINFPI